MRCLIELGFAGAECGLHSFTLTRRHRPTECTEQEAAGAFSKLSVHATLELRALHADWLRVLQQVDAMMCTRKLGWMQSAEFEEGMRVRCTDDKHALRNRAGQGMSVLGSRKTTTQPPFTLWDTFYVSSSDGSVSKRGAPEEVAMTGAWVWTEDHYRRSSMVVMPAGGCRDAEEIWWGSGDLSILVAAAAGAAGRERKSSSSSGGTDSSPSNEECDVRVVSGSELLPAFAAKMLLQCNSRVNTGMPSLGRCVPACVRGEAYVCMKIEVRRACRVYSWRVLFLFCVCVCVCLCVCADDFFLFLHVFCARVYAASSSQGFAFGGC
jgi:hypothetical protein